MNANRFEVKVRRIADRSTVIRNEKGESGYRDANGNFVRCAGKGSSGGILTTIF